MLLAVSLNTSALSETPTEDGQNWQEQKCALYQSAADDALEYLGSDGMSTEFLSRNTAFIESGCTTRGNACPRSAKELEFANLLTLMTMNEGMASSFVPFGCLE
ncbi:hypothetical protein RA19_12340 [Leisingera sp. ANG-M1]|uniref:hypothetical protein n=1 Tax=Leisingera sp. ANG-M1 TaxID=1577895 RepID=UPI000583D4A4|nr:hypothetical protein [Leisingera sp. ANG-M1]KIC10483.1 hypothetical protein RA19_12340 [Leisingera sp. ANG-M1]